LKKEKKVILINGENDDIYEQAIFVVRNCGSEPESPAILINEAEKIINNYVMDVDKAEFVNIEKKLFCGRHNSGADKKGFSDKNDFETTVNYIMLMCCVVIILSLIRILV
jgi:hypothetical protein